MKHADYEIVHIDYDRIFIADINRGLEVFLDKKFVFEEINKNFPGKRIILKERSGNWIEFIKRTKLNKNKFWYDYDIIVCKPYLEQLPETLQITGCPNSIFIRKDPRPLNKINVVENYFEKNKNTPVKKVVRNLKARGLLINQDIVAEIKKRMNNLY